MSSDNSVNNKRIAKNTLYLYVRMLFVMAVSLYTVRAILDILGVVDYGIYNVVGGLVTMFAFMNRTLSTSSQRYFSVTLAKDDLVYLKKVFSLNLTVFLILGAIVFLLLETVGLWFVNNKMTIPPERMAATNVVYQLSIVSMLLQIVVIPYMALVIAHEKMNIFAIIGVVEAVGRLAIVFLLAAIAFDKLIVYGLLILLLSVFTSAWYIIYCLRHYPESHYHWYWNKGEAMELLGFSGWHFLGTFSTTCRSQGINILINLFFTPAVNAARGVAFQVYNAVHQLVTNFFTAVKPQIYKSYASGQTDDMFKLVMRSSLLSMYLISLLIFPLVASTEFILGLWLKEVPQYTIVFVQLVLLNGLVDSVDAPLSATALATGKIRKYEIAVSSVILANIPISYVALKLGCNPEVTMLISIILSCVDVFVRTYMLKGMMNFPMKKYMLLFGKILLASVALATLCRTVLYNKADSIWQVIVISVFIVLVQTLLYALIADKNDRAAVVSFVRRKLKLSKA